MKRLMVSALLVLAFGRVAFAHTDPIVQVHALTHQIEENPSDYLLVLRRGEMHRLNQNWSAALTDYLRVRGLAPNFKDIDFFEGRMWLESGRADKAIEYLDRFLVQRPIHVNGRLVRGRALLRLGRFSVAAAELKIAVKESKSKIPDLYLEWAQAEALAYPDAPSVALSALDQGIAAVGPVVSLIAYAVSLAANSGDYRKADSYIDQLPKGLQRHAIWLRKRADLAWSDGRRSAALKSYKSAMRALERLPQLRRTTRANRELEFYLRSQIKAARVATHSDGSPRESNGGE